MPDKPKILIIDDEPDIVRSLSIRLRAAGYDVLGATDGATGLEMAIDTVPAGILLDMRMPGMDGFAVLNGLRGNGKTESIPVIAVSANVVEQVRSRALMSGACCFVGKPFQDEKIISTIEDVIGARGVRPTPVAK